MFKPLENVKEINMNIQAFLDTDPVIQIHMLSAMVALFIGVFVFLRQKGTKLHVRLGKVWVTLMLIVSFTGLFIHEIRTWGLFSPIHVFSFVVPISLSLAIYHARKGRIADHKRGMVATFIGGNIIAGSFTFLPGRLNHDIFLAGLIDADIPRMSLVALSLLAGLTIFIATFVSFKRDKTG